MPAKGHAMLVKYKTIPGKDHYIPGKCKTMLVKGNPMPGKGNPMPQFQVSLC